MTEQQLEWLEREFPLGFVLAYKPSLNRINLHMRNPKDSLTLFTMHDAAHDAWKELELDGENDEENLGAE